MKKITLVAFTIFSLISSNTVIAQQQIESDNRKEQIIKFYQIWDSGESNQLFDIASKDLIDHDASNPNVSGLEGIIGLIKMIHSSFSNIHHSLELIYPIGNDMYFVRWNMTGKHTGAFFGVPTTNKEVSFNGHDIFRFKDGKITENWHVEELLSLMGQISPQK